VTCACLKLRSSAPELKVASLNEARPVKVAPSNEARAGLLDLILRLHTGPVQRFPGLYDPAAAKPAPEDAASLLADLTAFLDDYIVQSAWQAEMGGRVDHRHVRLQAVRRGALPADQRGS
jgi:hypothetical protein